MNGYVLKNLKNNSASFIILFLSAFILLPEVSYASETDDWVDNQWVVDIIAEDAVYASVNGGIVHGDRLMLVLNKNKCDRGILATTIYSYVEPSIVSRLDKKQMLAVFDGREIDVTVVKTFPFLMGSRSIIEIMDVSIKRFIETVPEDYTLAIRYASTPIGKIENFFDISENNWKLTGVISAVKKAQRICNEL